VVLRVVSLLEVYRLTLVPHLPSGDQTPAHSESRRFTLIVCQDGRTGKIDIQIKWVGYKELTWEPMEIIRKDDPVTLAKYANKNNLTTQSTWKWTHRYIKNKKKLSRMYRKAMMFKKKSFGIRFQFGVCVPRTVREAYQLDQLNEDHLWAEAIAKEVKALYEDYGCFKIVDENIGVPSGCKSADSFNMDLHR
jgi:hypothetical protein